MRRTLALALGLLLSSAPLAQAQSGDPLETLLAIEQHFVDVAERVTPSVVTLEVHGAHADPFDRSETPFGGTGSGFVVDADGTIYTNLHVVGAADRIEAVLADGRRFKADFVAGDEGSDVAVVRLLEPPHDLPVAPLGDSDGVRVGQYAIAIGAPFGFASSFTVGHVSAVGRRSVGGGPGGTAPGFERLRYQNFLQVDAAINPGNSGGPLVDVRGNVIGINTAIASTAGHGSGVGFSIPINMARRIAEQLVSEGKVTRGWLGVGLDDINAAEAEAFGLTHTRGARITDVWDEGPAAAAKLMVEDVILAFNGQDIKNSQDLLNAVAEAPLDGSVPVKVARGDGTAKLEVLEVRIRVQARPPDAELAKMDEARRKKSTGGPKGAQAWLSRVAGVECSTAQGSSGRGRGVTVRTVGRGSLAADAELQPGDVIVEVDHTPVGTVEELADALRAATRAYVPLLVRRGGEDRPMSIERPR
jgi:serine protease Do